MIAPTGHADPTISFLFLHRTVWRVKSTLLAKKYSLHAEGYWIHVYYVKQAMFSATKNLKMQY
jgi:hypothetical protein